MGLLFISLLLGEPASILRARAMQPGDYFEKISSSVSVRYTVAASVYPASFSMLETLLEAFLTTKEETGCFFFGPSELSKLRTLAFIDSRP